MESNTECRVLGWMAAEAICEVINQGLITFATVLLPRTSCE